MKHRFLPAGLAGVFILGCAGNPGGSPVQSPVPLPPPPPELYEIIDHKAKEQGGEIPPWVGRYLEGGNRRVEELPEYGDRYVFIGESTGTNDRLLRQWTDSFTTDQNFARLAAVRIAARFSGAAAAYPDDEYGRFFETLVKAASDNFYEGAFREDDFWILRRYFEDDGQTVTREVYGFFILVTVDKSLLEDQVNGILNSIDPDLPPSREQTAAINRVKETFFTGF